MNNSHLKDVSKRFDEAFEWADKIKNDEIDRWKIMYGFTPNELKAFLLSEITTAYNQGREDTKNHVYISDISLDYVSKLNLLGKITEVHAKEINEIIAGCIEAALREERMRVVGELEKVIKPLHVNPSSRSAAEVDNIHIAKFNHALSLAIEIVYNPEK